MTLTRRGFIGSAAVALGGAVGVLADPVPASAATPAATMTRATFQPALGGLVKASAPRVRAQLRLVKVADLVGAPARSQQSFLLQFTSARAIPDGIYTITHPSFGSRQLFICAVYGQVHRRYEAVVNRSMPPTS